MSLPLITWYIHENTDYIQDNDYYLGSFNTEFTKPLDVQIWNNRYGQSSVESLENARLCIYFESIEDSVLLNYCTISINNNSPIKPIIELNKGIVEIGQLIGEPNNGVDNEKNRSNYKQVVLQFEGLPSNLRSGLKNMFLDIEIN